MIPNRSSEPSDGYTPDEALVLQVARGNEAAFEQLYDRFAPQVFGLVSRLLSDEGHKEEVTQKSLSMLGSMPLASTPGELPR